MLNPPKPSLAAGRNHLRLIFADDAAEIAQHEMSVGLSQRAAVAGFVDECYEFRHVQGAPYLTQLASVRLEISQIDPLVWRLVFDE